MTIKYPQIRLTEFQTFELFKLQTLTPNTYLIPLYIEGNSLLSSLFVQSMDNLATIKVNYFDYTTGNIDNERYNLQSHSLVTPLLLDPTFRYTNRVTVTRIHNKPYVEVIVSGGNVNFGVYATVVSSFASDLDAALQLDGEAWEITRDKGIPIATLDRNSNTFKLLSSVNGRLQIDIPDGVQTTTILINKMVKSSVDVLPNILTDVVIYTIPTGKKFYLLEAKASSDCDAKFELWIDGNQVNEKLNNWCERSIDLGLGSSIILLEGQVVKIKATNRSVWGSLANIKCFLYGSEQNI